MSVIVTANYEGESFEIEIFRDGSLEFPGHSLEYDRTVTALGGKSSTVIQLEELWAEDPFQVISKNLGLPENRIPQLAADYAEHVLPFYEDKYRGDLRPRAAIDAVRDFITEKIDLETLRAAEEDAWVANRAEREASPSAASSSASSAAWAARGSAASAVASAASAAAYYISLDIHSVQWQQAYAAEVAWQIRRFVDCMEAVGQGLPWPPLEATP